MSTNRLDVNEILKGSSGDVWINGRLLTTVQSIEIKFAPNFEDINVCGEERTYKIYNGWSGEGSLTIFKTSSEITKMIIDGYMSGVMPDVKIIASLKNKATKKAERCAITGVTFTEATAMKFEKQTNIEEEFPFNFTEFEYLETI